MTSRTRNHKSSRTTGKVTSPQKSRPISENIGSTISCTYCGAPRPTDPYARFCNDCGNLIPPLPEPVAMLNQEVEICPDCKAVLPPGLDECVFCDAIIGKTLTSRRTLAGTLDQDVIYRQPKQGWTDQQVQLDSSPSLATTTVRDSRQLMMTHRDIHKDELQISSMVCGVCGITNPAGSITSCLSCEARLPENASKIYKVKAPSNEQHVAAQSFNYNVSRNPKTTAVICERCGRKIANDAHYCDWCGTPPTRTPVRMSLVSCSRCGATNRPQANFCAACGVSLNTNSGDLMSMINEMTVNGGETARLNNVLNSLSQPNGKTALTPEDLMLIRGSLKKNDNLRTASTQTVGIFYKYPGPNASLHEKMDPKPAPRQLPVTSSSISPGKGYWRQQVDHITMHLKAKAANDPEFRSLISHARLGKLLTTVVHEGGLDLSVTAVFALHEASNPNQPAVNTKSRRDYLTQMMTKSSRGSMGFDSDSEGMSQTTETRDDDSDSTILTQDTDRTLGRRPISKSRTSKTIKTKKKRKPKKQEYDSDDTIGGTARRTPMEKKRSPQQQLDFELLEELSKDGDADIEHVRALIDRGANVNARRKKTDESAILIAAEHGNAECVEVLIEAGGDLKEAPTQAGIKDGNSLIHELVIHRATGAPVEVRGVKNRGGGSNRVTTSMIEGVLDALQTQNAKKLGGSIVSLKKPNGKGETPHQMATRLGCEDFAGILATRLGKEKLKKLAEQRLSSQFQ